MRIQVRVKGASLVVQKVEDGIRTSIASAPLDRFVVEFDGDPSRVELNPDPSDAGSVTIAIDQQLALSFYGLANKRGIPPAALAKRLIEQGIGRVCLPCAGMGTDDNAIMCGTCKGAGVNPRAVSEYQAGLRRYQLMVKHIALLAEAPHPLTYDRAGGDCVCQKCGLLYFDHPKGSEDFLTLLCDGSQVKL